MAFATAPYAAVSRGELQHNLDRMTFRGILLSVILLFAVSGGLLWRLGYNYDGLTGGAVTKIHPFTYTIVLVTLWRALSFGNPFGYGAHVAARRPAAVFMLGAGLFLLAVVAARAAPGVAGIIDTWIAPALLAILLTDASERDIAQLSILLHILMTANGLLSLYEFVSKNLLFPYRFEGAAFEWDTRSSALHGHPLVNATITATYTLALMSGCRNIPGLIKLAMIGLQCAALVVFGGRTAMVFTFLIGGLWAVKTAFWMVRNGQIPLLGVAGLLLGLAVLPMLVVPLVAGGHLDSILMRFVSDGGSANARVLMFDMFAPLSIAEIIIGPNIELIESMRRINGLEWGIENPIIRSTLYNGAFMTALMLLAYGVFLKETAKDRMPGIWMPILVMIILFNSAESVASKTTMIAKVFVILICAYPRKRRTEHFRIVGEGQNLDMIQHRTMIQYQNRAINPGR